MSNWTLVGEVGFKITTGVGNHTETLPGSPAQNDIVVIVRHSKAGGVGTIQTSGYTTAGFGSIAYKVLGATPDTDIEIARIGSAIQSNVLQVWRPAIPAGQTIDNGFSVSGLGSSGMPNPPSHTLLTNGSLRIVAGNLRKDDVASSVTAPAGYGNLLAADTEQSSTTVGATSMIASKQDDDGGSEDPAAFGGSGSDAWVGYHFGFRIGGDVSETDPVFLSDAVSKPVSRILDGAVTAQSSLSGTLDVGFTQTFVRHDVSGRLVPKSSRADSTSDGVFSQLVRDAVAQSEYRTREIDLGADLNVRVWGETVVVDPPEGGTLFDLMTHIDWRTEAGSYQGFRPWTIGLIEARFIKMRLTTANSVGIASLEEFTVNVDAQERTELHTDFAVASGGAVLTYDTPFATLPHIEAHPDGDNRFVFRTNKTVSQVTLNVRDESGADVGGTVDVTVIGV